LDSCGGKAGFEWFAVELRKPETGGTAADIADGFYFMSNDNLEEFSELETRMPNGKKRAVRGRRRHSGRVSQQATRILPKHAEVGKRERKARSCNLVRGLRATSNAIWGFLLTQKELLRRRKQFQFQDSDKGRAESQEFSKDTQMAPRSKSAAVYFGRQKLTF
jgi:hypothetical protein